MISHVVMQHQSPQPRILLLKVNLHVLTNDQQYTHESVFVHFIQNARGLSENGCGAGVIFIVGESWGIFPSCILGRVVGYRRRGRVRGILIVGESWGISLSSSASVSHARLTVVVFSSPYPFSPRSTSQEEFLTIIAL